MTATRQGLIRPRPIRFAYLVDLDEASQPVLDAVFRDCHGRWGGRFSLIVPCRGGEVDPAFWPWLQAFDADVIYAYARLEREAVLGLRERLGPAEYIPHRLPKQPRGDSWDYRPEYRFTPLSSLSTVFRHSRYLGRKGPLSMLHTQRYKTASRLFTDNFGAYDTGGGGEIIPTDARASLRLRPVTEPEDRRLGRMRPEEGEDEALEDELAALRLFAGGEATSMSLASLMFAPKLEFDSRWGHTFNLVIGDTVGDRLLFWNARLHLPGWLDTDLHCLRVSPEDLADDEFRLVLAELLRRRNRVNAGSGGQSRVTLRSTSLPSADLEAFADAIRQLGSWNAVHVEAVASLDQTAPDAATLKRARQGNPFGAGWHGRPEWTAFEWTAPAARPPVAAPDHLLDAPIRQAFIQGYWAVDVDLEAEGALRLTDANRWHLPKRWPVERAFDIAYAPVNNHQVPPPPRACREGMLTAYVTADTPLVRVGPPSVEVAVRRSLTFKGYGTEDAEAGRHVVPARAAWAQRSNEAGYLDGVLGLFGDLDTAAHVLLHPFLAGLFADLGGTTRRTPEEVERAKTRLTKLARRQTQFDLADDDDLARLTDVVLKIAQHLEGSDRFVTLADLQRRWTQHLAQSRSEGSGQVSPVDLDPEADDRDLERCLVGLRKRKALFQGYAWTCDVCLNRNWRSLSGMGEALTCEVCNVVSAMPVAPQWSFKANPFLIDSLKKHSVLSLVWALRRLSWEAKASFLFAGPTALFDGRGYETHDREIDLLVLSDGRALACEVKSSWMGVTQAEIDKLVETAARLRPDDVVLAVMEAGDRKMAMIDAARSRLAEAGIGFRLLTRAGPEDDAAWLPF